VGTLSNIRGGWEGRTGLGLPKKEKKGAERNMDESNLSKRGENFIYSWKQGGGFGPIRILIAEGGEEG